jgi:tRNA-2-methylthio-N6-dimethylallyladenosine synthase
MTDDVPFEVKRRRLLTLQTLQKALQLEANRAFIGRELKVLCLGPSPKGGGRLAGRTEGNLVVNFESPRDVVGKFVTVRITGSGPYSLHGELAA